MTSKKERWALAEETPTQLRTGWAAEPGWVVEFVHHCRENKKLHKETLPVVGWAITENDGHAVALVCDGFDTITVADQKAEWRRACCDGGTTAEIMRTGGS